MTRKILHISLAFFLLLTGVSQAMASNSALTLPLPQAPESPSMAVDDDSYEAIRSLAENQTASKEISILNLTPRSTIDELQLITGKTRQSNQKVWIFLISSEQQSYQLGSITSNRLKEFTLMAPALPASLRGEAFLIATLVSDYRLSLPLTEKTVIIPFYRDAPTDLVGTAPDQLTILIEKAEFFQDGRAQRTLQSRSMEVYTDSETLPLKVAINGEIFGKDLQSIELSSVVLPSLQQTKHEFTSSSPHRFSATFEIPEIRWNDDVQIILIASEARGNILEQEAGIRSTNQVLHFRTLSGKEYPTVVSIAWQQNKTPISLLIVLFWCATLVITYKTYRQQSAWAKVLSVFLISFETALITYLFILTVATGLFQQGLLNIPGQEQIILDNDTPYSNPLTLTKLDENLEIVPALSTSWSNISPHIWEFVLRSSISAESIVLNVQKKIQTAAQDRQYLASVKSIVSVNPNKIQFITQFPDPLLPQKLSKVVLDSKIDASGLTQAYLPLETSGNSIRSIKSERYFNLPFLKQPAHYQTILRSPDLDSQKQLILAQHMDLFDEPETKVWPQLLQNNYRIVPKINTQSIVIMTDRTSYFLKDPGILAALKKILNSPRILQTSYFQYGQLANQFAPPGVTGYIPELESVLDPTPVTELLETGRKVLKAAQITLTFQYPSEEKIVARVVQQELEIAGIKVIPLETTNQDYEEQLLSRTADLTLIPLDFDLGDVGPFLDALIDSESPFNKTYRNAEVDDLIRQSRTELNSFKRLELLQQIMKKIVVDDPAGIPLLFKRSFIAIKKEPEATWWERWLQREILGWK